MIAHTRWTGATLALLLLILTPPLPLTAQAGPDGPEGNGRFAAALATITAEDAHARLSLLADDALLGRATPSPGLDSALAYAVAEYRRMGLEPAGDDGGYLQRYPYLRHRLRTDGLRLVLHPAGAPLPLAYGTDFALPPADGDGFAGELVYLGVLADDPAAAFVDLDGMVPVVRVDGELDREWNRRVVEAMRAADAAGAAGILVALDPSIDSDQLGAVARSLEGWRSRLEPVHGVLVRWAALGKAFEAAGRDPETIGRGAAGEADPVALGRIVMDQPLEERDLRPANALALLPGSDPSLRDELVVVTAHIDHVGVGRPDASGDSIYNGADDNASGTVGLLEIAEAFAALSTPPARPVLFAAVSGEERGLLGSRWLADHAPVGRVVADINLDMISRAGPDTVAVIGQELSELGPWTHELADRHPELGLVLVETLNPELPLIRMSDQAPFLDRGVPGIFFNTGKHPDLHRPSDEVGGADPDKMARVTRLAFLLTHAVADRPEPPALTEAGRAFGDGHP